MIIDELYSQVDKNNYYLGMVSQVYKDGCVIQTENLTWLNHRRINQELLIPNTINYYVVIDSVHGLFIGEVYQAKIQSSENTHNALKNNSTDKIFPELYVDIIAILAYGEYRFKKTGFTSVGLMDKVYISNKDINKKYLESTEDIGKKDVKSSQKLGSFAKVASLGNQELELYPETLFDRHLMTIGTTNSGKSTTALSILDKLIEIDKKVLIIDPTGEYACSFPEIEIEKLMLGINTMLNPGKISFSQWATLFETNDSSQPSVLANAITSLRFQKKNNLDGVYIKKGKKITQVMNDMESLTDEDLDFDLSVLPSQIVEEAVEADRNMKFYEMNSFQFNNKQWLFQKVDYKLKNVNLLNFFGKVSQGKDLLIELEKFVNDEITSLYINASEIGVGEGIGSMIVDLISNYLINAKKKDNIAFVVFIDEVHRYSKDYQAGGYQTGLNAIAREGRKKGIFLFLTTQNPNDVPEEILGQIGTLLVHRLTHKNELESIRNYLSDGVFKQIPKLGQGEAIFTSINILKDVYLNIDKCNREHFNETTSL